MSLMLLLPGAAEPWPLPPHWTDADLRFAWKVARDEGKELRIEIEGYGMLMLYPAQTPWYAITGSPSPDPDRCPETTERFMTGAALQCHLHRGHDGVHTFEPE